MAGTRKGGGGSGGAHRLCICGEPHSLVKQGRQLHIPSNAIILFITE